MKDKKQLDITNCDDKIIEKSCNNCKHKKDRSDSPCFICNTRLDMFEPKESAEIKPTKPSKVCGESAEEIPKCPNCKEPISEISGCYFCGCNPINANTREVSTNNAINIKR